MKTVVILGRQPKLSLAELESVFSASAVQPIGREAALINIAPENAAKANLGGSVKLGRLLAIAPTNDWGQLLNFCRQALPEHIENLPEGKLRLGLSIYGIRTNASSINRGALELKKVVRETGRSVRVIPNKELQLNSAQVLHNKLTGTQGVELLLVAAGKETYIAQTTFVQDIDEYSARDFGRPKRSGFVGMLPPKLAQIMLNTAQSAPGETVLDPFCGTGVVLQEAILMGCKAYGTDIEPKMIEYSTANLQWLKEKYRLLQLEVTVSQDDAQTAQWQQPIDRVVCETYLGQPMTTLPPSDKLQKIVDGCDELIEHFLQNLATQIPSGTRCCIGIPAWRQKNSFLHLPVIDQLEKLGYNRVSFEHASDQDLIYHRDDQIVARELLVLTRK